MTAKNPISIEVLEILDAIDRRGSFARAAEELEKATSALSYGVQKLEEQLRISLFRRQGRRSVLTPAGRLVLQDGREILQATARLADRAREVATGWEPHLRIAVESLMSYPVFFSTLASFLEMHGNIELDISECVLNGGWEALEQDRVDLVVGAPGPVPLQMGFRAIPLAAPELVAVIATHHPLARLAANRNALTAALGGVRRIVTHDTSAAGIARSAGLGREGDRLYVQNIEQKEQAIRAGLGIGHLPRDRIQDSLDAGTLIELDLGGDPDEGSFLAWRISNKGKGLQALCRLLAAAPW